MIMKLTDNNIKDLLSARLVERPRPETFTKNDHMKPNTDKKSKESMVAPAINNLGGELSSMT